MFYIHLSHNFPCHLRNVRKCQNRQISCCNGAILQNLMKNFLLSIKLGEDNVLVPCMFFFLSFYRNCSVEVIPVTVFTYMSSIKHVLTGSFSKLREMVIHCDTIDSHISHTFNGRYKNI